MRAFIHFIHCCTPRMHVLPQGTPPPLRRGFTVFLVASVVLWGLMVASAWWDFAGPAREVVGRAAITVAVAAVVCWVGAIVVKIVVDHIDDPQISLLCERLERHSREAGTHVRAAGSQPSRPGR